ncbi:hypothetical protein HMPREF9446_00873 [Bacteroides fluxus YIT 12057]|uniref:Uncharacterized protein n=1 Tax=Bacteroides fluxus YIT 12057 TaxID=763034 RepID=F3PQ81_9BACE|nr:hypothetical protein HMPREF9446_00873 [Bacteroides fluxus YIT 12057]
MGVISDFAAPISQRGMIFRLKKLRLATRSVWVPLSDNHNGRFVEDFSGCRRFPAGR